MSACGVVIGLVVACGGSSRSESDGSSGTSAGQGGSSSGAGGGAQGGASGATSSRSSGQVYVVSLFTANEHLIEANASFSSGGPSDGRCTTDTIGPCEVTTCSDTSASSASSTTTTAPDAGPITIASATTGLDVTLTPATSGSYSFATRQGPAFTGAGSVVFTAAGNVVPAFTTTLPAPAPTVVKVVPTIVDPASDLSLAWDGGVAGVETRVQTDGGGGAPDASLICTVDSTLGALTIPSAVLERLAPGTNFLVLSVSQGKVTAGDFDVAVLAGGLATGTDGNIASFYLAGGSTSGTGGTG
ncbi:MAG TPA: hypothetical protein VMI54_29870 [Polyangiaceae bacterium]|nr:hypothetical protein [Polyangiaceae bacterium]